MSRTRVRWPAGGPGAGPEIDGTFARDEYAREMATEDSGSVEIPIAWIGVEDVSILTVNQILSQLVGKDEFILTFGQVAPPIILGTDEQKKEQMRMVTFAAVKPVARIGITRQRAVELLDLLQQQVSAHDEQFGSE